MSDGSIPGASRLDLEPIKARHVPDGEHFEDSFDSLIADGYDDDYAAMWAHASYDIAALIAEIERLRAFPVRETAPAEKSLLVDRDAELLQELRNYLDEIVITSYNIGDVRHRLFVPWHSQWNGWVRYETAARENKSPVIAAPSGPQETP